MRHPVPGYTTNSTW